MKKRQKISISVAVSDLDANDDDDAEIVVLEDASGDEAFMEDSGNISDSIWTKLADRGGCARFRSRFYSGDSLSTLRRDRIAKGKMEKEFADHPKSLTISRGSVKKPATAALIFDTKWKQRLWQQPF